MIPTEGVTRKLVAFFFTPLQGIRQSPCRHSPYPSSLNAIKQALSPNAPPLRVTFIDLCEVLGHPHPAAADQTGETFAFEKRVSTNDDGKGYADVWKRGCFGWEYKGKHRDLAAAYRQLLRYREDLENPPLLVTCDQERFEIHTNFERTRPQTYSFKLDDLLSGAPTANCALPPLEVLRAVFFDPDTLRRRPPVPASPKVWRRSSLSSLTTWSAGGLSHNVPLTSSCACSSASSRIALAFCPTIFSGR